MRLERLTVNKIKIFLTSDDLFERGLSKEDIWKDSIKWNQLFHEMLEEASAEFDVDIQGSVAVEIFTLQAQGMILIITVDEGTEDEEVLYDGFIDMQVRVEGCEDLLYVFEDFEDIISLSKRLALIDIYGGNLYAMDNRYYFLMDKLGTDKNIMAACILSEYGIASIVSPHFLEEYGKEIIRNKAVEIILQFFK
jgi:adapter protein MecA 1/2